MKLRLAASLALALLVPGIAAAAGKPTPLQAVQTIEQQTVQIRGLPAAGNVRAVLLSDAAFSKDYTAMVNASSPSAENILGIRESQVVGFVGPSDNPKKLLGGTTALTLGYYDYPKRTLYVRNDANSILGPNRYIIAHEYTHALQDHAFKLAQLLPDQWPLQYRNSDAVTAHHALTEGDAVNVEDIYINRYYTRADLAALIKLEEQPTGGPKLPVSLTREVYFPYTTGLSFVQTLYKRGGMAAVNAAYHRLPSSTYEILYPQAYLKGWKPVDITLHGVAGMPAGWQQVDDDVWGAFGYKLILWQWLGKAAANRVVVNYRGDRYLFFEQGKQNALLLKSTWRDHASAVLAKTDLLASLQKRWRHATMNTATGVLHNKHQNVYLAVAGSTVTMSWAPTAALARQMGTAPTT